MSDSLVIQATDSLGRTALATFIIPIYSPPVPLWPDPIPAGTVGVFYSYTLTVSGGIGPFVYSVSAGALPGGITLNSTTGVVSGTPLASDAPTVDVIFAVTFAVTDNGSP